MSVGHPSKTCSGKANAPHQPIFLGPSERAEIYRDLASLYRPPTWDRIRGPLDRLLMRHPGFLLAGQPYIRIAEEMDRMEREAYHLDIEVYEAEHVRLFVNALEGVAAPPYASFYHEGRLLGRPAQEALAFYRRFQLGQGPACTDPPDHIAVELEFLRLLCSLQEDCLARGRREEAESFLQDQAEFFFLHLFPWAPKFCRKVLAAGRLAFYSLLAAFTLGFLLEEKKYLEATCPGACPIGP